MKRKLYDRLLQWKNEEQGESALLIEGARRVGKSWLAMEFAKNEYKAHLLIDFSTIDETIKSIFYEHLGNVDVFFEKLLNALGVRLPRRKSLIIFDEVQCFPRAREAIKTLVADGRYDYIETGSLMSIKENTEDILIPSEETHVKMYPMDFEEYLWSRGDEMLMDYARKCYADRKPLGEAVHRKAMGLLREYMIVGGMPQVVKKFCQTKDLKAADRAKRKILALYRDDIAKHARRYSEKVRRIFDEIPGQLSKHEKKFKLSALGKGAKMRSYEDAFLWLNDAMIVNTCYNTTEPNVGLRLNLDNAAFKCYMADTGLLVSHTFDDKDLAAEDIHKRLLVGKLEINEGMLMENVVAQMLVATGHPLFFFYKYDKSNADERMEIDFLIAKSKIGRHKNIIPLEVKSSKRYTTKSLDKFVGKYKSKIDTPIILHTKDLNFENGILHLPLYMTPVL